MLGTQTLAGTLLGTQTLADNDALSPGGTLFGTQTLGHTPQKKHKAWQYKVTPSTTAGEAAELRKFNAQSIRNARNKAKGADKSGEPARESLAVRAVLAGIHPGPLGVGAERVKAQRALSQDVRRAELSAEDQVALNERRKDLRAEQTVQKRDALNASQKAYKQVIMCMYSSCTQHMCAWLLGVGPATQTNDPFDF